MFEQLLSQVTLLDSSLSTITEDVLIARANQRIQEVNEFEEDIVQGCVLISQKIDTLREKVDRYRNTSNNINGCLMGGIDDYIESFEGKIESLKQQL